MLAATDTTACEFLAWDSEFWHVRIARVVGDRLNASDIRAIDSWCRSEQIACAYFLASAADFDTTRLAEQYGFNLVDVRVTFARQSTSAGGSPAGPAHTTRPATFDDLPALERIAQASYRDTRFYHDPRFPTAQCDALYATWIRRSVEGYADAVLVSEAAGAVTGFVSCHLPEGSRVGTIGLVGVSEAARGAGVGTSIVASAVDWFARAGTSEVHVATQGRNVPAQRLYERCGFLTHDVHLWYHKWFA